MNRPALGRADLILTSASRLFAAGLNAGRPWPTPC